MPDAECNVNVLPNYEWTGKGYFYTENGINHNNNYDYYALPLIPVIPGHTYRITVTRASNYITGLCKYYDENKQYVQDAIEAANVFKTIGNTDFVIPDNVSYIGISYSLAGNAEYYLPKFV